MKALTNPISVTLLAALLCSCGVVPVGLEETDAFAIVDEFEASISRGTTTRDQIHERFGEPAMSHDDWRVEIYRSEDEDFFWLASSIPAGYYVLNDVVVLLVVYDDEGVVADFDTGFAMERNEYRASSGRVYAEAGGFTYLFENDYIGSSEPAYEALLAPEEESMALLESGAPDDACLLAIRKANPEDRSAVYLDGQRYRLKWAKDEPMRFRVFHLPPGEHEIRVKPPPGLLSVLDYKGKLEKSIVCNGGDSIFADVSVTMESGGSWARSELKGEIRPLRIPEAFFGSRAMLFQGGEWVGLPPVARPVAPRPLPDREPAQR